MKNDVNSFYNRHLGRDHSLRPVKILPNLVILNLCRMPHRGPRLIPRGQQDNDVKLGGHCNL